MTGFEVVVGVCVCVPRAFFYWRNIYDIYMSIKSSYVYDSSKSLDMAAHAHVEIILIVRKTCWVGEDRGQTVL